MVANGRSLAGRRAVAGRTAKNGRAAVCGKATGGMGKRRKPSLAGMRTVTRESASPMTERQQGWDAVTRRRQQLPVRKMGKVIDRTGETTETRRIGGGNVTGPRAQATAAGAVMGPGALRMKTCRYDRGHDDRRGDAMTQTGGAGKLTGTRLTAKTGQGLDGEEHQERRKRRPVLDDGLKRQRTSGKRLRRKKAT